MTEELNSEPNICVTHKMKLLVTFESVRVVPTVQGVVGVYSQVPGP